MEDIPECYDAYMYPLIGMLSIEHSIWIRKAQLHASKDNLISNLIFLSINFRRRAGIDTKVICQYWNAFPVNCGISAIPQDTISWLGWNLNPWLSSCESNAPIHKPGTFQWEQTFQYEPNVCELWREVLEFGFDILCCGNFLHCYCSCGNYLQLNKLCRGL